MQCRCGNSPGANAHFYSTGEHVALCDGVFVNFNSTGGSEHGATFALSDANGRLTFYGTGSGQRYVAAPEEQYYRSFEYKPCIYDARGWCVDEDTLLPHYLVPLCRRPLCKADTTVYETQVRS